MQLNDMGLQEDADIVAHWPVNALSYEVDAKIQGLRMNSVRTCSALLLQLHAHPPRHMGGMGKKWVFLCAECCLYRPLHLHCHHACEARFCYNNGLAHISS